MFEFWQLSSKYITVFFTVLITAQPGLLLRATCLCYLASPLCLPTLRFIHLLVFFLLHYFIRVFKGLVFFQVFAFCSVLLSLHMQSDDHLPLSGSLILASWLQSLVFLLFFFLPIILICFAFSTPLSQSLRSVSFYFHGVLSVSSSESTQFGDKYSFKLLFFPQHFEAFVPDAFLFLFPLFLLPYFTILSIFTFKHLLPSCAMPLLHHPG